MISIFVNSCYSSMHKHKIGGTHLIQEFLLNFVMIWGQLSNLISDFFFFFKPPNNLFLLFFILSMRSSPDANTSLIPTVSLTMKGGSHLSIYDPIIIISTQARTWQHSHFSVLLLYSLHSKKTLSHCTLHVF